MDTKNIGKLTICEVFKNMNEVKGFRDRKNKQSLKMLFEIESFSDNCTNFGGACLTHDGFAFSKDIDVNKMIYCFQLLNNNMKQKDEKLLKMWISLLEY